MTLIVKHFEYNVWIVVLTTRSLQAPAHNYYCIMMQGKPHRGEGETLAMKFIDLT